MTYATCEDCGSVGRFHYAHCRMGDQPRTPLDEPYLKQPEPDSLDRIQAEMDAGAAKEETTEERFRTVGATAEEVLAIAARAGVQVGPDVKVEIADEAKRIVSGARRSAYGKPEQNFERIARYWDAYFKNTGRDANITAADVSPLMRLMKEARLNETPDHRDSFVDLVGYALTGAEVNQVKATNSA